MPESRDHLEQIIDVALTAVLGELPKRDEDGDIAVVTESAVVFVRVLPDQSFVRVWSEVVVQVTDSQRANFEVSVLNRDRPFTKFQLVGDRIVAQVLLPTAPFVPAHLRQTICMMCDLVNEVDDDLAVRVSGRRFAEACSLVEDGSVVEPDDD